MVYPVEHFYHLLRWSVSVTVITYIDWLITRSVGHCVVKMWPNSRKINSIISGYELLVFNPVCSLLETSIMVMFVTANHYRKNPKNWNWDTWKIAVVILKLNNVALPQSYEFKRCRRNGKQCRPWSDCSSGAVWSGSALFAETCMSENLGSLWYFEFLSGDPWWQFHWSNARFRKKIQLWQNMSHLMRLW